VRRGASWTAAYHRRLTVAAVARPVRSGVGALGVLAAERSWVLLAQTTSARSSVQPVSSARARRRGRPCQQARHGVGRRCPAGGVHPSGLGVRDPAVRCPVTWGRRPEGPALGRPLSSRPAVCCPPVWCPAVRCRHRRSGRVRLLPCSDGGGGTRSRWPGDRDHRNRWRPGGCRAVDGSTTVAEAGMRATLPTSRWSLGGGWRTRAAGLGAGRGGRACPLSDQAGQAGVRSPSRAAARWAREQAAARGGRTRHLAAVLGWWATTVGGRRRA
jgi:hypothetical protein